MGYIVKALAKLGMGEPEKAMQVFDLAFRNCNPSESDLLLLVKVDPFTWRVSHMTEHRRPRPSSYSWLRNMRKESRALWI